ncbi:MAG: DUF1282 family protein [Candidatus Competibacteraceae bacterium]|nr:DUF1282 family protein [Candidatus Competibacteraceae bacterium]MCB1769808.1 DUF1282 family protein [Candidatus Competibacteraceae bacterium]MCB1793728.1 DUF1282 family protein [Candidatus Competibacteraceae bacterium]MCP5134799.1 DUF1282 family protein [Gammaproteobacteria bacterium]HPE71987.1 Yip1 family protein [Candidatus Competibacter sp.]
MNLMQTPKMIFSFHAGWDDIIRIHPSVTRLFAWVVLPLSLLPPAMIFYAGGHYGDVFAPGVSPEQWHTAAGIFFIAELLTVPLMAWLIHLIVTKTYSVTADYHECFTLAAIAPIPLWLSSLALFVPSLSINIVIGILALICSAGLIYHGVYALFRMRENLQALQMATVIAGTGLFAWLVLVQIVLRH